MDLSQLGEQPISRHQAYSELLHADRAASLVHYVDPVEGFSGHLSFAGVGNALAAGGFRVHPGLTASTVQRLAGVMALKQRVLGLGVDGAKSGIAYDPRAPGKAAAIRRFFHFIKPYLLERYSMGPDMGTRWDEIERHARAEGIASVKIAVAAAQELPEGEVLHRLRRLDERVGHLTLGERRAGHALAHAAIATLEEVGYPRSSPRVGIQGFGTLGRAAAAALVEAGLPVTAVGDEHGCLIADGGLDVTALLRRPHHDGTRTRPRTAGRVAPPDAVFEAVDVLLLAACEDAVDADARNALAAGTRAVVVGANLGLSADTEQWLHDRGVVVVPDFVGGCGGPASMDALFGPPARPAADEVLARVAGRARALVREVLSLAAAGGVPPREAALRLCAEQDAGRRRPYGDRPHRGAAEGLR
ncbi:MAG TPA: Glu/Leu/Phe/Val dehydrogenase dimerization domain-containing protein [Egibacteraceae bacterium]|nr:Glu/Leu/Phe/Val dehydrogenase dimerization domain-containing protein [Egibacteraceae bacterium]